MSSMRPELIALKKEMVKKRIDKFFYAIDELPRWEGYCIYDARSTIEVFYFERGVKHDVRCFSDVSEAIDCFKEMVFSDQVLNRK